MKPLLAPHLASVRGSGGRNLWPVVGFGISMIVDYGALYYAFTVLAPHIGADLGWASSFTYGAISIAFFAAGLIAPLTGRLLDKYGGRYVMSAGTAIAALALVALSMAQGRVSFVVSLIVAEIAGTAVLYNAAFTTLTQIYGRGARRAITFTTLVAAFSSTLIWPLTSALLNVTDWRGVVMFLALLLVTVSLPIHLLMPATGPREEELERQSNRHPTVETKEAPVLTGAARRRAFRLLVVSFSMTSFVLASLPIHFIPLLTSLGYANATAVLLGTLIGPSQFLIRFLEMVAGQRLSAVAVGLIAAALVPAGLVVLMLGGSTLTAGILFAVVYGMGQGLESIAKGIVPLALFGTEGYGALLGKIAMGGLFVSSGAPWIFAVARETWGPTTGLILMTVAGTVAALAYLGIPRQTQGTTA